MSNSSESCRCLTSTEAMEANLELVIGLLNGVSLENGAMADELSVLGDALCAPAPESAAEDRIVWMQAFDRLEQVARAQAKLVSWLAGVLIVTQKVDLPEIAQALSVIPVLDMKNRLSAIAGTAEVAENAPEDDDMWLEAAGGR